MFSELFRINSNNKISPVNNPFSKTCITDVTVCGRKRMFGEDWYFSGIIKFQNGNTSGEHKIEGDSMNDVIRKTDVFIHSI